ncbi:hypothetical protein PR202_ga21905 [Eleusine coracana subsp. coracana]|uniref:O-methyltransferase dimerisation domain-containing protein n=1 Tax=Eleusine coracana subsp. coracana TaxID=191504 RepID=A0AAV5D253_ELECO|nr:hypothetical protein PR202_ga21905 [Eleusine coracana subsp. coracana]
MVFHHSLSFITSMALKCAVDLGIPDAIHLHGGSATLVDIVAGTGLHESRLPYVKRLMNVLSSPAFLLHSIHSPVPPDLPTKPATAVRP